LLSYNRIDENYHLSSKKAMFLNLKAYYQALKLDYADTLP